MSSNHSIGGGNPSDQSSLNYLQWLDCQPPGSVLCISQGSFLSASSAQIHEIAAGLCDSGVRFLWVARGEVSKLKKVCGNNGNWKIGWRVKKYVSVETLVTRGEISWLLKKFMDLESDVVKDTRNRAGELKQICQVAIANGGSSQTNINAFVKDIGD
ncbi:UDP-glycosyltransferase [Quillaja saponaria]|uniref:UDP-glycosyltransferase n=1 Tax=Quillaja saponaria TaxID=32244 RepID=A0AAD7LU10_QUISA|nr:UDP-glycosyltransferase [Quillaja saponaria]